MAFCFSITKLLFSDFLAQCSVEEKCAKRKFLKDFVIIFLFLLFPAFYFCCIFLPFGNVLSIQIRREFGYGDILGNDNTIFI